MDLRYWLTAPLLIAFLLVFGLAPTASGQTPNATVENEGGDVRLQSLYDGGLLAPGTVATISASIDSIPAEGPGTRMMWYPARAAFRAGRVGVNKDGTQWDATNVGFYSVAFGIGTQASGAKAAALGDRTTASGNEATAIGDNTTAATGQSLSIGECNSANSGSSGDGTLFVAGNGDFSSGSCSRSDALVLDKQGNLAVSGSFELPDGTVLSDNEDLGVPTNGNGAFDLSNDDGVVASGTVGSGSIPTEGAGTRMMWYPEKAAFRAGRVNSSQWDATSVGDYSVAFGEDTEASGDWALAMGQDTEATASRTTAMGERTAAVRRGATAMGFETRASGLNATAMGGGTTASGFDATAMGSGTEAATDRSLSLGECNSANRSDDGTLLAVGNGSYDAGDDNCSPESDALVLDDQGNLTTAGNVNGSSDRRLKTSIESLEEGILQKLAGLRPVRYEFKDQQAYPSGEQIGLIAQDVQEEFPSLVSEGPGGMLSLAYPKLTAVLLKGIQEQQAKLKKKQAQIDSLKEQVEQIEAMKDRLAALEAEQSPSVIAGLTSTGGDFFLAFLLGGLLGAGLLWRRRN